MRIVQINSVDKGGGAGNIVWNLFNSYKQAGYYSKLIVSRKFTADNDIFILNTNSKYWNKFWFFCEGKITPFIGKVKGFGKLNNFFKYIGSAGSSINLFIKVFGFLRGREDFYYPETWNLLNKFSQKPDVIHCHNLHSSYFDLRFLPYLSKQIPVVLTLHDAWLLSGHCAHSFDCQKWKQGCDKCSDLDIYPRIFRDAAAFNWELKASIYSKSRLYIATPCKWLMDKVENSILMKGIVGKKVIYNGVDTEIFKPANKVKIRSLLGFSQVDNILLFVAQSVRVNKWKDFYTLRLVVEKIANKYPNKKLIIICLGDEFEDEYIQNTTIKYVKYNNDPSEVAKYYQASDIYVHSSKVDTFPNSILEALACGIPVVATNVGGICEQVNDFQIYDSHFATGCLVKLQDVEDMYNSILFLLEDENLKNKLSENAFNDVMRRFTLKQQVTNYLNWYKEILINSKTQIF